MERGAAARTEAQETKLKYVQLLKNTNISLHDTSLSSPGKLNFCSHEIIIIYIKQIYDVGKVRCFSTWERYEPIFVILSLSKYSKTKSDYNDSESSYMISFSEINKGNINIHASFNFAYFYLTRIVSLST